MGHQPCSPVLDEAAPLACRDAATTECARRVSAAYEALRTDAVAATNWSVVLRASWGAALLVQV
jgi:hypothetical protein